MNKKFGINDVVIFVQHIYPFEADKINHSANIVELNIDGDDAIELLERLGSRFAVDFSRFEFHDYFHDEIEIARIASWLGFKKIRRVKRFSVEELYAFMSVNCKA